MVNHEWPAFSKKPMINMATALKRMTQLLIRLWNRRNLRAILVGLALIILLLVMVWARVFYGSMETYREGETHFRANQYIKAITFFDRSLHWYAPFNPYIRKSAERLWEISKEARKRGDIPLALIATRTIRRGFVAARSFYAPGGDWIGKCDQRISALLRIEQGGKGNPKEGGTAEGAVVNHPRTKGPDIFWSIILLVGLLGWIASAIGLIISGFRTSKPSGLLSPPNFKWMLLWALFFAIWIFGMMKA